MMRGDTYDGEISAASRLRISDRSCRVCEIIQSVGADAVPKHYFLLTISSRKGQFGEKVCFDDVSIGHVADFGTCGANDFFAPFTLVELNETGCAALEKTTIDQSEAIDPSPLGHSLYDPIEICDAKKTYVGRVSRERAVLNIAEWPCVPCFSLRNLFEVQFTDDANARPARLLPGTPVSLLAKTVGYCIAYFADEGVAVCLPPVRQGLLSAGYELYDGRDRGRDDKKDPEEVVDDVLEDAA